MQAEIIAIGTELLLGEIVDTNSSWIAQQLAKLGLNLFNTHTVGDNPVRISDAVRASLARSDVVITTGGLGPTVDDWTREAIATACGRQLHLDESLLEEISAFFKRRGRPMTENNRKQAMIPDGALLIHNPVGTAPCFAVEQEGHLVISLPGVPHEMKYLMEHEVLPMLRERFDLRGIIKSRIIHTCGIGESAAADKFTDLMELSNPTVGTAAHPGQTDIRITVKADNEAQADELIAPVESKLRERLGAWIYGADDVTLPGAVLALLRAGKLTLATFETACDGQLAAWFTHETESREAYPGGIVCSTSDTSSMSAPYNTLHLTPDSSQEEADAAAMLTRQVFGTDLGLAITGIMEGKATEESPAYISLTTPQGTIHVTARRNRAGIMGRGWLLVTAVDLVRRTLLQLPLE